MLFLSPYLTPILLLIGSNVFMTTAWYWHLRYKDVPFLCDRLAVVSAYRFGSGLNRTTKNDTGGDHLRGVRRIFLFIFTRTDHPESGFGFALIATGAFFVFHTW